MTVKHWQDPVNLVLGLWLFISPWVLYYETEAMATRSAVVLGLLIAAVVVVALFRVMAWEEWVNVALGVATAVSPWVVGFSGNTIATWNAVLVGVIVAALALWTLGTDKDIGGWWSHAT